MWKNKLLLVIALFLSWNLIHAQSKIIDKVIVIVGDRPILLSDLEKAILQAKQEGVKLEGDLRTVILDQLIFEALLVHNALVDSVDVSDAQVNNKMEANLKYFESQIGGRAKLEEFYGKTIEQIKEEFFDQIKDKLLSEAMQQTITGGIKITPAEVRTFFNKIPVDSLPFINSYVEMAQITIIPKVSDEEKLRARKKLEKVREEILSGAASFCVEAISSDDPGSAGRCGEYDFVRRGTFVPEFDAAAFSLKDGQYSEIFETSYGFHFLQLIQRRGEEYKCRHILFSPKISSADLNKASSLLDSIYKAITNGDITFHDAAAKYSSDEETKMNGGKMMNPYTGDTHFDIAEMDPQLFILVDRMKVGDISKPATYNSPDGKGGFRIIKLINRSSPHRANLTDDYQMIQNAAQNEKERTTIEEWVKRKIATTYIWIAEEYRDYNFRYNWLKKAN